MSLPEAEQQQLKAVMARVLSVRPDSIDLAKARQTYPIWDSLKHLELMMEIEKEFGIRFTSTQITRTVEPAQIVNLLADLLPR